MFSAPRSLKDAVNCKFSNFSQMSQPAILESVREKCVGVRSMMPSITFAAARISSMVMSEAVPAEEAVVAFWANATVPILRPAGSSGGI